MTMIHHQIFGQGQPLVMLHGWAMHSAIWRDFAERLGQHYRVICLDLPGHGHSAMIEPYTLPRLAETLLAAVDTPRFALLGWSLGATVALQMAALAPDRVDHLLLLAGNPRFTGDADWPGVKPALLQDFAAQLQADTQQTLLRFLALQVNGLADGKVLLKRLKAAIVSAPAAEQAALQAGLTILLQADLRPELGGLRCPVTVLQGDIDTLIPKETAPAMQTILPTLRVERFARAGHVPFLSHADALIEAICRNL